MHTGCLGGSLCASTGFNTWPRSESPRTESAHQNKNKQPTNQQKQPSGHASAPIQHPPKDLHHRPLVAASRFRTSPASASMRWRL